jgi:transposase-like protein
VSKTSWQRCRVRFMRNCPAYVAKGRHSMVAAAIRAIFAPDTAKAAHQQWRHVAAQRRPHFAKLAGMMEEAEHDVPAFIRFPRPHWPKSHSDNPLERLNKQVKRRSAVVGVLPDEAGITRLVGAILFEQNDERRRQHRHMTLETMTGLIDKPRLGLPVPAAKAA